MKVVQDYQPDSIDFTVKTNEVPLSLGKFKNEKLARKFVAENTVALQADVVAERNMDETEIIILRDRYSEELEEQLPELREALLTASQELEKAKEAEKKAKETVNASLNKIQELANKVKSGVTDIDLDKAVTWEIPYNNKSYYYTYVDGELKLATVKDIPSYRTSDLLSSSEQNQEFFTELDKAANE